MAMVIQRLGGYFTKLQVGDQIIGINAPARESSLKQARFGTTVALASINHHDFNGVDSLRGNANNTSYAIRGPGEYEIAGIFVNGFPSFVHYEQDKEQLNTIYSLIFDDIRIVYLGPLSNADVDEAVQEDLYQADIIFVPIGGDNVLGADEAFNFIKKFSPKIVIPIGYDPKKNKADTEAFANHFGERATTEDKLTIKKKDLEEEQMNCVVLNEVA